MFATKVFMKHWAGMARECKKLSGVASLITDPPPNSFDFIRGFKCVALTDWK